jgi:hypothetical protein
MCNNKMIHRVLLIMSLFGLFSCRQNANDNMAQKDTSKEPISSKESWTVYSKQDTIIHVKRLTFSDTAFALLSYDINTSQPEATSQSFISAQAFANENEAASAVQSEGTVFNWIPFKAIPTLFVQIAPSAFIDDEHALNIRQDIEQKIEGALKAKRLGDWTAGDLGPGGANMLFEVSNTDAAMSVILQILSKEGLDTKVTIARRIYTEAEDWFYEVLYPTQYNSVFMSM